MNLSRFLTRNVSGFRLSSTPGVVGAREQVLQHFGGRCLGPYRGPFENHVMLIVKVGAVALDRHGRHCEAHAGDALLIARGDGGQLSFVPCPIREGFVVEILSFDERSLAPFLRNSPASETLALAESESPTAFAFHRFQRGFDATTEASLPGINRFKSAIGEMLRGYRPGLAGFLRNHFYWPRWMLCIFLERYVTAPDGAKHALAQYATGSAQLRRDSLMYLGAEPEVVLSRRRCELAAAWLRCGHSIDDVAQALNYSSRWEFERAYSGSTKKRCRDVQQLPPLTEAEPEDLIRAMTPYWWGGRKLAIGSPAPARMFSPNVMSEEEEAVHIAGDPVLARMAETNREKSAEAAAELRDKAGDFFAMKSTGAEVITPIFELAKPQAVAA